jgi:hypothetical protein
MTGSTPTVDTGAQHFPVAVILERQRSASQWRDYAWQATGITVGRHAEAEKPRLIRETEDSALFIVGGLDLTLYADECESYYFNLVSDTPRAYIVAHLQDTDSAPQPFRISMSFDEAHAYLEGEDEIFAVDVPAEIYRWTEAFVIANYFPEKKRKRKLRDWGEDTRTRPRDA